jgi:uncharacterized protein
LGDLSKKQIVFMGKRGGRSGRQRKAYTILIVMIAVIAIAVIAYIIHSERRKESGRSAPSETSKSLSRQTEIPRQPSPEQKKVIPEPEGGRGQQQEPEEKRSVTKKVAIIIDDIGYDLAPLRELIQIDAPVTFAIFPYGPHSAEAAKTLHRSGRQILLHLPMEPRHYPRIKTDRGALLMSMDHDTIRSQLEKDLQAIPYVVGVNNHMGSRFMEDPDKLFIVMQGIKDKGLFFIDSRTTPLSKGQEVAERVGIPFAARNVFIDNDKSYNETLKILMLIIEQKNAGDYEEIVMIGHPRSSTIAALKKVLPLFKEQGIEVVAASGMTRQVQKRNISRKSSSQHAN